MTSTDNTEYLIRTAFQRFGQSYLKAHPNIETDKFKAMRLISMCKTGDLGYNISICEECGHQVIHAQLGWMLSAREKSPPISSLENTYGLNSACIFLQLMRLS